MDPVVIYQSVGLGLVVSLAFSELLGIAAGGLVVPGYVALYLDEPQRVAGTFLAALLTFASVKLISRFVLLYGRRTLIFSVLAGFLFGELTQYILLPQLAVSVGVDVSVFQSIGYIIPGLIAYWMLRQGVLETLSSLMMASFVVRLILVLAYGGRIIELGF